ncbi:Hypothetical protein SCF082_LOCUS20596 [Durusdinium trenchii]|uniref:Uncharacterized protein n=1 Tax=Durusdinium trenchii TaxID=1381693 RepID=A0ABP0L3L6_9DINO
MPEVSGMTPILKDAQFEQLELCPVSAVCLKKRPVEDEASRYAITFGEVALLHIGGRELGAPRALGGFTVPELVAVAQGLPNAELVALSDVLPEELRKENEAATLVIRNGASVFLGKGAANDFKNRRRSCMTASFGTHGGPRPSTSELDTTSSSAIRG